MAGPRKILIVEDDTRIHEFYAKVLAPHQLTFFTSCEEGLAELKAGKVFDLIICDLDLLGMTGFVFLDKVKQGTGAKPPVIICSSLSDPGTQKKVLEGGAVAFVSKPIQLEELLKAVGGTFRLPPA